MLPMMIKTQADHANNINIIIIIIIINNRNTPPHTYPDTTISKNQSRRKYFMPRRNLFSKIIRLLFGAFSTRSCKNSAINFPMSVCKYSRAADWIFIKFDIWDFY
jgi:hypothetical protein